ncbi:MAG: fused MFS/spermidine synthase [Nannocystaceae bacterium]
MRRLLLPLSLLFVAAACGPRGDGDATRARGDGEAVAPAPRPFAAPPPSAAADALPAPKPPALTREATILEAGASDYSKVQVKQLGRRRSLVFLRDGGGELVQTTIEVHQADQLVLPYARAQASALLLQPSPGRVLVLGLGGGTLPRFFHRMIPDAAIDAVEIDPLVVRMAKEWFGVAGGPRLRIYTADALAFIAGDGDRYDLIYVDAFLEPNAAGVDNIGIPDGLRERAILEQLRGRLEPGGVAVFNLHFRSGYAEHAAAIAAVFPRRYMIKVEGSSQRHILAVADDGPLPSLEALAERAAILDGDGRFGLDFAALVGEMTILEDG